MTVYIHALREEGDVTGCKLACRVKVFLSTPSARRATRLLVCAADLCGHISIHALREEGDYGIA